MSTISNARSNQSSVVRRGTSVWPAVVWFALVGAIAGVLLYPMPLSGNITPPGPVPVGPASLLGLPAGAAPDLDLDALRRSPLSDFRARTDDVAWGCPATSGSGAAGTVGMRTVHLLSGRICSGKSSLAKVGRRSFHHTPPLPALLAPIQSFIVISLIGLSSSPLPSPAAAGGGA